MFFYCFIYDYFKLQIKEPIPITIAQPIAWTIVSLAFKVANQEHCEVWFGFASIMSNSFPGRLS